ncbi:MAG: ABC transporter permease subunit [Phycisphaerales bacterium]
MTSYIIRRLLLIVPTVLGITFMIFMLVALSPGGIGAALQASSGSMEQTDRARQEAYLEERYGLKDPVVVQYGRWLARVSPIKFGRRDLIRPDGEVIRAPRPLGPPVLAGDWYAALPAAPPTAPDYEFSDADVEVPADAPGGPLHWLVVDGAKVSAGQAIAEIGGGDAPGFTVRSPGAGVLSQGVSDGAQAGAGASIGRITESRDDAYRRASDRYAFARAEYIAARSHLEEAVRAYANWGADRLGEHNTFQRRLTERRALLDDPGEMSQEQIGQVEAEIADLESRLLSDAEIAAAEAHRDKYRGTISRDNDIRAGALRRIGLERDHPLAPSIGEYGQQAVDAYQHALAERENLIGMIRARPFPSAGFWVVPGYVSIGWPDLGVSFSRGSSVQSLIGKALPVTLMLNCIAFPVIYMLAVPTGLLAAVQKGRLFDHISGIAVVALWSIPVVVASVLMLGYLANRSGLLGENHFPTGLDPAGAEAMSFLPYSADGKFHPGLLLSKLHHMVLPLIALIYPGLAVLNKQTRASMLDNFSADYVRTAKAKGVAGQDVVFRHVLRNSLLPLITMFATIFPAMLSGSIIVERVFNIQGMGTLIVEAINLRDRELLLANVMIITCVNLLALLLADILYALADPRISYS